MKLTWWGWMSRYESRYEEGKEEDSEWKNGKEVWI